MENLKQEILKELDTEDIIFLKFILDFIRRCKSKKNIQLSEWKREVNPLFDKMNLYNHIIVGVLASSYS